VSLKVKGRSVVPVDVRLSVYGKAGDGRRKARGQRARYAAGRFGRVIGSWEAGRKIGAESSHSTIGTDSRAGRRVRAIGTLEPLRVEFPDKGQLIAVRFLHRRDAGEFRWLQPPQPSYPETFSCEGNLPRLALWPQFAQFPCGFALLFLRPGDVDKNGTNFWRRVANNVHLAQ
jgi:hypothetical protein